MTVVAFDLEMSANQFEVSKFVVESRFVKTNDVGTSAFVIGVTDCAFSISRIGEQAVKPVARINIGRNVFVAIHTKFPLPALVKHFVAGRTLRFPLQMTLDNFARHDQRFDILCHYISCCE